MDIKRNPSTGGTSCVFQKGENFFYADRSYILYTGMETMIFHCTKDGKVTDWSELYCDHSGKSLKACVKEFLTKS